MNEKKKKKKRKEKEKQERQLQPQTKAYLKWNPPFLSFFLSL
jgi:hypothetical protein